MNFKMAYSNPRNVFFAKSILANAKVKRCLLERFSNDCRKTKTKAITPTNHDRVKQRDEPITIPIN